MQMTNPLQGILAASPKGDLAARASQAAKPIKGDASFDDQFAMAQAASGAEMPQMAADEGQRAQVPGEGQGERGDGADGASLGEPSANADETDRDDDAAALVVPMLPVIASWAAPEAAQDAAEPFVPPSVVLEGDVAEAFAQVAKAPEQDAPSPGHIAPEQGIDILEGTATPAETDPESAAPTFSAFMEEYAQAADMESAARAQAPAIEETLARMPTQSPIVIRGEAERQDAAGDPSSLENADANETTLPPSRVEMTQVVAGQSEAPETEVSDKKNEFTPEKAALSAQRPDTPFSVEPQADTAPADPIPALQIVEEAQIQQAMGRAHFTMRLRPESLGEVTVRLTMVGEGIQARIITRGEGARSAIAHEVALLGESMRERGIDVRSIEILDGSMGQASLLHDGRQGGGNWDGRRRGGRANRVELPTEAVDALEQYDVLQGLTEESGLEVRA